MNIVHYYKEENFEDSLKWQNLSFELKKVFGKRVLQERMFAQTKSSFGRFLSIKYGLIDRELNEVYLLFGVPNIFDNKGPYSKVIINDIDTFLDEIWES